MSTVLGARGRKFLIHMIISPVTSVLPVWVQESQPDERGTLEAAEF